MGRLSEAEMLGLLRTRLTKPGNGGAGEYALMTQVRNSAGFDASRTFDAVSVSLWPSRGLEIHAYEVKCSRSDWLRELKNPAKAEAAAKVCDRFWMVVDKDVVRDGELPETWGLLVVSGTKLRQVKAAPLLPGADVQRPIPRTFLVPMLRAAGAVPEETPEAIRQAQRDAESKFRERYTAATASTREAHSALQTRVHAFENAAGVSLEDAERVGAAVRAVIHGDNEVMRVRNILRRAGESIETALAALPLAVEEAVPPV